MPGITRTGGAYGRYGINAINTGMRPEKKYIDTIFTGTFDTTGEVLDATGLNLIAQGDTATTRDGRECWIKSIHIRGEIYCAAATGVSSSIIRLLLILDTQCNGAYPAVLDVLSSNGTKSFNNLDNSKRFKTLKDWHFAVNTPTLTTNFDANTRFSSSFYKTIKYHKRCNIPIEFSSTTGAITEIKSNNLILIGISSVADDTVSYGITTRLRFMG